MFERKVVGIFGKCNSGKSSLINALTNQQVSIVSNLKGTTTDPVRKAMELVSFGPIVLVDCPGFDDFGLKLSKQRVKKSFEVLEKVDAAIIVVEANKILSKVEKDYIKKIEDLKIPFIVAVNKIDLEDRVNLDGLKKYETFEISAKTGKNIDKLVEALGLLLKKTQEEKHIISNLLRPLDVVVLVVCLDSSSPVGRLILPQQRVIKEVLDSRALAFVCNESEYSKTLSSLNEAPKFVVADSQIFSKVVENSPKNVLISSFSIVFARFRGILEDSLQGVCSLEKIKPCDRILIAQGCTHSRKCDDIGSVKLPKLISKRLGFSPEFEFCYGCSFPDDLKKYRLIIHCGGCMLTEKEVKNRFALCRKNNIPATNYGVVFANINGTLQKSLEFLKYF